MTIARSILVNPHEPGLYHCISRCVRRAFLCGDHLEHRRAWIRDRLEELTGLYAIDVAAYAVMSNHLHLVVRTDPERTRAWSAEEVAERWLRLCPGQRAVRASNQRGSMISEEAATRESIRLLASDERRISVLRERLGSLGWFMKSLKEPIARRANREDRCTGHFWEGRFKSPALLDDAAVLACCVYVDLNPVRAGIAAEPAESDYTSIQERVERLSKKRSRVLRRRRARRKVARSLHGAVTLHRPSSDGAWLLPIGGDARGRDSAKRGRSSCDRRSVLPMTLEEYVELVTLTASVHVAGRIGSVPRRVEGVLERLGIDTSRWFAVIGTRATEIGTAIGSASVERRKPQGEACSTFEARSTFTDRRRAATDRSRFRGVRAGSPGHVRVRVSSPTRSTQTRVVGQRSARLWQHVGMLE